MSVVYTLVAFIVAIGVLITVHEFGHFIVARALGVRVLRFSVGFGRALYSRVSARDGTEYVIAALPIGGYVKMLDEREGEVEEAELPRAFNRQPLAKRVAITAAGPAFNLLFAILAYWAIFVLGVPGLRPLVGPVAADTPAAHAGFRNGDEIEAVDGESTPTWEAAGLQLLQHAMAGEPARVKVKAEDGSMRTLSLSPPPREGGQVDPEALLDDLGLHPWQPTLAPVIGAVEANSPASKAGLKADDRIVTADGQPVQTWDDLVRFIRDRPDQAVTLKLERGGVTHTVRVTLGHIQADGKLIGHIGAGTRLPPGLLERLRSVQRYGFFDAAGRAVIRTGQMSWLTLDMVWKMLTGQASWRNLSGPINIAQYAGYTARVGLVPFLAFLAVVSISLGVLNLLPIPVLDGGHLLYYLVEAVRGRPLSLRAEIIGQQIGIALLMLLMGFAVFNDLSRIFG